MAWLKSGRLQYTAGVVALFFLIFVALRAVFYFGFSEVGQSVHPDPGTLFQTLYIGVKFDLRLAILLSLPVFLLTWLPRYNVSTSMAMRKLARVYIVIALLITLLLSGLNVEEVSAMQVGDINLSASELTVTDRQEKILAIVPAIAAVISACLPGELPVDTPVCPDSNGAALGTDDLGRDLASRLVYGARFSMSIGLIIVVIAMLAGVLLGAMAGMRRGLVEASIMRLMDIILALPSLLLAIVIVAVLGASLLNAAIAVAIVLLPHFVRITRASIVAETSRDYVLAAQLDGAHGPRLFAITLLPNISAPLIVQSTLAFSSAILDIAALGFLGLGAQPPTPEWGTLLSSSREFIERAPWTVTLPGLAILVTVMASNLLGDGLRDALDPKLKR